MHWRHNGASNHRRLHCLLNRLCRRRSKKISKLRVTDLCEGNSPVTGGFPSQRASNGENVSVFTVATNVLRNVWMIVSRNHEAFLSPLQLPGSDTTFRVWNIFHYIWTRFRCEFLWKNSQLKVNQRDPLTHALVSYRYPRNNWICRTCGRTFYCFAHTVA